MNLPQNAVFPHHYEAEKDLQFGETHLSHWNKICRKTRVRDLKKSRYWAEIQTVKLFATIINKMSDERKLRDLHLKHYHMSLLRQFTKRTTHLHIPGKVYHLYQHVVKTCPFCNLTKPRPDRSRVSAITS